MGGTLEQNRVYVYFLSPKIGDRFTGPTKVGIAKHPTHRLRELQTACPFRIHVAFAIPYASRYAALRVEREVHAINTGRRLYGEWFDATPETMLVHMGKHLVKVYGSEGRTRSEIQELIFDTHPSLVNLCL